MPTTLSKKPILTVQKVWHRDMYWWAFLCKDTSAFNQQIRSVLGRKWSVTLKAWLVPLENLSSADVDLLFAKQFEITFLDEPETPIAKPNKTTQYLKPIAYISDVNQPALAAFHKLLILKGYSQATIKTYEAEFCRFLATIKGVDAQSFTPERIKDYLYYCATNLKLTEATLHSKINALKFYFEQVLGRDRFFWEVPRPKKRTQLPNVISEDKIIEGIEKLENLKHKTIIMLAYSAGLRVSETVHLKITDIQSDRMQILIRQAKGKKDRIVPLSKVILNTLREYYKIYKPKEWLFEGQFDGEPYSTRSAQAVFNQVYRTLGLPKGVTFHALRHSFATHLVENGIDVTFVQQLLGHNDVRTTLRYMHVSQAKINQIESPLDRALRQRQEKQNESKKN